MTTRSGLKTRANMFELLPLEIVSVVFSSMKFAHIAKCAEINKTVLAHVDYFMQNVDVIEEKIPVGCVKYVVDKCHCVHTLPYVCGRGLLDLSTMKTLLRRWPNTLLLDWNMTTPPIMSSFLAGAAFQNLNQVQQLTLKVIDQRNFSMTDMNLHYMNLKSLHIDAEGCCLERILLSLNCRCWDVESLYLRGDVVNLASIMMKLPHISDGITIINTNDAFVAINSETEHGIRYLINGSIKRVKLINIIKFCCEPPSNCSIVDLLICAVTGSVFDAKGIIWEVDRLQADMIEALLDTSMSVQCGVFQSEMTKVVDLQKQYVNRLKITSIVS
jgi:hypothetical protein